MPASDPLQPFAVVPQFDDGEFDIHKLIATLLALLLIGWSQPSLGDEEESASEQSLKETILALDSALFSAFNSCDIDRWRGFLDENIEFYQDNDDVTTTREELEASFLDRCDAAGRANLQRELVLETVEVHPIQGYGAVQIGSHRFWIMVDGSRDQLASTPKFVHLWRNRDGVWRITRVISYGH